MGTDTRIKVPWYFLAMVVLLPGVFTAVGMSISLKASERAVQAESNARRASELAFCQLLAVLDSAYKAAPPTTSTGRQLAVSVANLMVANHCP